MDRRRLLQYMGLAAGTQLTAAPLRALAANTAPTSQAGPGFLLNQLGLLPSAEKAATVRGMNTASTSFRVFSADGDRAVFQGTLTAPKIDPLSGDLVSKAAFSAVTTPGTYILEVGITRSLPFLVQADVYAGALRSTVRGYTGQRCGCTVDLGGGYQHPACHLDGSYGATSGKSGALPNLGGWHDAGDYGRYVVNSGITCGTLLWAWEMYPGVLRSLVLGIARTHTGLPDFLEEVLWNLDWMLQMQDTDGGVFHKQTSQHFCAFIMPQDDHLVSEVIGTGAAPFKSTCATADFAAVMAIAARCYREFETALADRFLAAGKKAWQWAVAHPAIPFNNPPSISTGGYGDPHCSDEIAWASAELWRTTGEAQYEQAFLRSLPKELSELPITVPTWSDLTSMACWTYAMADRPGDPATKEAIRRKTDAVAKTLIPLGKSNGYGNTMVAADYGWGSNSVAANHSMLLLVSHHFHSNAEAVAAALDNLHYLLGRNCHDVSWVTQVGHRPFMHPHHRPSAADGIIAPWPGLLSGGPNRRPSDRVANTLPAMPPMRMWIDDEGAYSMNEIAINWNAPLVFTLAAANALSRVT